MAWISLLSDTVRVQAPFIVVEIAGVTFGKYMVKGNAVTYPNYMQSLSVVKVGGAFNQYTINLVYVVRPGDDPNMIDKILSANPERRIKISYGDYSLPSFIFREEEAIISDVQTSLDMKSQKISYMVNCTSSGALAGGVKYTFA